jgi:hypothetical protein
VLHLALLFHYTQVCVDCYTRLSFCLHSYRGGENVLNRHKNGFCAADVLPIYLLTALEDITHIQRVLYICFYDVRYIPHYLLVEFYIDPEVFG